MKVTKPIILLLFIFITNLLFVKTVHSTHTLGGDMTWQCVGQDSFTFTLTLYRDCNGVNMSSSAISYICISTGANISTSNVSRPSAIEITPSCDRSCTRCASRSCSFQYGIQKFEFTTGIVNLSSAGSCCNISAIYENCCRGGAGPFAHTYIHIKAKLNRCLTPSDNSPEFLESPLMVLCVGQNYFSNNGVYDTDIDSNGNLSDSLVYEWTNPLGQSGVNLNYPTPYSKSAPLYFWSFPFINHPIPKGFHLDQKYGNIAFKPMKIEETNLVLKVKEFRNGTLIGEIMRDYTIVVISCPNNSPPELSGPYFKEVCANDTLIYTLTTFDLDQDDTLSIDCKNNLQGAVWADDDSIAKHPTGTLIWIPDSSDISDRPYTFTVTVKDDKCPVNGSATVAYHIFVRPNPVAQINIIDSVCGIHYIGANPLVSDSLLYDWTIGDNKFTGQGMHEIVFDVPGIKPVLLTVTSAACSRIFYDTIITDSFVSVKLPNDTLVCYGENIFISADYDTIYGTGSFKWSTGDTVNQQIYLSSLFSDTTVWFTFTDNFGCTDSDSIFIKVHDLLSLGPDLSICNYDSGIIVAPYQLPNVSFEWFKINDSIPFHFRNSITVNDSDVLVCTVTDSVGCYSSDTIVIKLNPNLVAYAPDTVVCSGDTIILIANKTGGGNEIYKWYELDSLIDSSGTISLIPTTTTNLKLVVEETTASVTCYDTSVTTVIAQALPQITFNRLPERCKGGSVITLNNYVNPKGGIWSASISNMIQNDTFYPIISGNHSISYKYTDSIIGCIAFDTVIALVHSTPIVFAGLDDTTCKWHGNYPLIGNPSIPEGTWSGIGIFKSSGSYYFNPKDPNVQPGVNNALIYQYVDSNGCISEDTMNIIVYNTLQPNAGIYDDQCTNNPALKLKGSPPGGIWSGDGVSGRYFDPSIGKGTYLLIYELTTYGHCPKYAYTNLVVNSSPSANFGAYPVSGKPPLKVHFIDSSSISSGSIDSFIWIFGDGDTSYMKDSVYHTYDSVGDFTVSMVLQSDKGCIDTLVRENYISTKSIEITYNIHNYKLKIWPNPSQKSSFIHVDDRVKIKYVNIYNSIGEKVSDVHFVNTNIIEIKRHNLNNGLYYIQLVYDNLSYDFVKLIFD